MTKESPEIKAAKKAARDAHTAWLDRPTRQNKARMEEAHAAFVDLWYGAPEEEPTAGQQQSTTKLKVAG